MILYSVTIGCVDCYDNYETQRYIVAAEDFEQAQDFAIEIGKEYFGDKIFRYKDKKAKSWDAIIETVQLLTKTDNGYEITLKNN